MREPSLSETPQAFRRPNRSGAAEGGFEGGIPPRPRSSPKSSGA